MWKFSLGIFLGCLLTSGLTWSDSIDDYYNWERNRLLREQNRILEQRDQRNQFEIPSYQPLFKQPC